MSTRYVLEATWSGYTASQSRVVHREVITPKRAEGYMKLRGIRFTDNTFLRVTVRPCEPRERVQEVRGYRELLSEAYGTEGTYVVE
jgi:hypothetical protein